MSAYYSNPLGITTGDHNGIGPEIISKGLLRLKDIKKHEILIFGNTSLFARYKNILPKKWKAWSEQEFLSPNWPGTRIGHLNFVEVASKNSAFCCGRYIELATKAALSKKISGICTAPIDKNNLQKGGYHFDGHTEMLQNICNSPSVTMMMSAPKMKVSLVTTHVPLRDISKKLTEKKILSCLKNTYHALRSDFGIKNPKIAVLGLNPHAGDKGLFGDEEIKIIKPAIKKAKRTITKNIDGPFPSDGFFAQWDKKYSKNFDAIICMYHDQGLVPIKLYDFENTVNISLGLPIVRTSVDHGVGFDIAKKNIADSTSFCAAVKLAKKIILNKERA